MPLRPVAPGVNDTAAPAAAYLPVGRMERGENLRKILDDALQLTLRAMHQRAAHGAIPFEGIAHASRTPALDDEAQAAGLRPLW